jgi:hypothetical protein
MAQPALSDEQCAEVIAAVKEHGSVTTAAVALGIPRATLQSRYHTARTRFPEANLQPPPPGFKTKGYSEYRRTPEGAIWQKVDVDKAAMEAQFTAFIEELSRPLKGLAPYIPAPEIANDQLLAVYPIGDHHHGMKSDPDETGSAYDCKIATRRLTAAVDYLCATAPPASQALLLNLGDYYHMNDSSNRTPQSGNLMDVDTRFGQVFDTGAMALIHCVLRLLEKHQTVHVWNMRGNHDPDAAQALAVAMSFYFHDQPRVVVDRGPSLYKFLRFGKNLIGSHHGHGAKAADLPLLMAVDRQDDWAATEHRVWHLGHFHHKSMKEHPGCDVEVHRTLAGSDAWHAGKGYRSKRDMQVICYHIELGEVQRHRFDPMMLGG